MANWKDSTSFSTITYKDDTRDFYNEKHNWQIGTKPSNDKAFIISLQYDSDSETPESCNVRFKLSQPGSATVNYHDSMYILYDVNNNPGPRKLLRLKGWTKITGWGKDSWAIGDKDTAPHYNSTGKYYFTDSIKITKKYTDQNYSFQDFWICNNGDTATTATASNFYSVFGSGSRTKYKHVIASGGRTMTGQKAVSVYKGSTVITDNYNNTFTIKATKGASSTYNTAGGPANLKWGYSDSYEKGSYTNGQTIDLGLSGTSKARTIYATSTTTATYGDGVAAPTSANIRQYVGPNLATNLKIGYNKSRFTLKENWTFSWTAPSINNECPIKGYRIRLYRKRGTGSWIKLPIYDRDGGVGGITRDTTKDPIDCYWDRDGTSTSITIYTKYYDKNNENYISIYPDADIQPGDEISFAVTAYTKYGENYDGSVTDANGNPLCFKTSESFYCGGTGSTNKASERQYITVQNAGIVRVNVGGEWKEGQVYIRADGEWKEAETVSIKTADGWKESE